jgi:hypothetical protein
VENRRLRLTRRAALAALAASLTLPRRSFAFGAGGAFHPRLLDVGEPSIDAARASAPARWSWELIRRTSAPARLVTTKVRAEDPKLVAEPFLVWAGHSASRALSDSQLRGLERFFRLGGMLIVDDVAPEAGAFGRSARREIARVLPESSPVRLDDGHVIYKSYYIIDRPVGRVVGTPYAEAIVRNKNAQVVFLAHDLLGALARTPSDTWAFEVAPGGPAQREMAVRLAVNLAMYLLCSDYKDDQVHAPWLMRRRAPRRNP